MPPKKIPSILDDNDCERPACADMQQLLRQQQQQFASNSKNKNNVTVVPPTSTTTTNDDTGTTSSKSKIDIDKSECPANISTLGRASWTLLHSTVRYDC
jgi:hypothetical protein